MLATALAATGLCAAAQAEDVPPTFTVSVRDTIDLWDNASGGDRTGTAFLNKLQLGGSFQGDKLGLDGLTIHLQLFRTDGNSLSTKVGDIQTVDSIDARPATRLFESWIEKKFGDDNRSLAFRAGLMDLNADYDSIQTSALFVNSSQGIAADLARSGRNGPSIYPVSSLGFRVSWLPSQTWTFRLAAFDGVPGNPNDPKAFVAVKLGQSEGALLIGQIDYHLSDKAKVEAGLWRYTTLVQDIMPANSGRRADEGAYVSVEGPVPGIKPLSAWIRLGIANGSAQQVAAYVGGGLVAQGLLAGRPEDRLGVAISRAMNSRASRLTFGLDRAETDVEVSYQVKLHDTVALQPDLQYVIHPSERAGTDNALVIGLRIVLSTGYPKKAPATEATDPTVPPEGSQPTDDNHGSSPHPS